MDGEVSMSLMGGQRQDMTVASVTMAGSSMSALLWTIRSSSWGGLGLRPGPANSEGERGR